MARAERARFPPWNVGLVDLDVSRKGPEAIVRTARPDADVTEWSRGRPFVHCDEGTRRESDAAVLIFEENRSAHFIGDQDRIARKIFVLGTGDRKINCRC